MSKVAQDNMTEAADEIRKSSDDPVKRGLSEDSTWLRRDFSSFNGWVMTVFIHTGNMLDLEVQSQYC